MSKPSNLLALLFVSAVFLLTTSCGQSGPLYLPNSTNTPVTKPGAKPAYGTSTFLIGMNHPAGVNSSISRGA